MLKFFIGVFAVFCLALYESGLYSAFYSAGFVTYFSAGICVPFRLSSFKSGGGLKLYDYFGGVIIISGFFWSIKSFGISKDLFIFVLPFIFGVILFAFINLYLRILDKRT
ncbi:hypothetical protein [Shewanella subflava]|uniref:Uncharacterized protein n=1 Tax=Shewanella subflava TaxID=2986476 RepID=A0ABT3ID09_9GAMM|nr:hypothetical protein [Shewanella subflava]MCW3173942.1 hypothetical protein [Shewanella subflava]